jgi:hypothetical protein
LILQKAEEEEEEEKIGFLWRVALCVCVQFSAGLILRLTE